MPDEAPTQTTPAGTPVAGPADAPVVTPVASPVVGTVPAGRPDGRPLLGEAQIEVLRRYGTEHAVDAGDVLFADGDERYDLIVILEGRSRSSRTTVGRTRK